ncbi:MAG: nucleoside-diphosphate sugar epimerase/dehydratase [Candidatus Izemoplasmatales bacterium]|nr:nucleoside-diphosphate sugar epimerase/dehydratase [Candidatus Izemoplasmatales bacterium]
MKRQKTILIGEYLKKTRTVQFMIIDALGIVITYALAFLALKFSMGDTFDLKTAFIWLIPVLAFKLIVYYVCKIYKLVLENVGFDEGFRIFLAVTATNAVIAVVSLAIPDMEFIPELYLLFTTVFEAIILISPRMLKRIISSFRFSSSKIGGIRTLLVGAGAGGRMVLNEIRNNLQLTNIPVAFVDDDPTKIGRIMSGYRIYGPTSEIPKLIDSLEIDEVIISIANIESSRFQELIKIIAERPVKIKRLPKFKELKKEAPKTLLEVNVEDLLSRDVIELDDIEIHEFIHGKRVMVTGAGGSIGSELVRQIVEYQPAEIIMVDIYENCVYDLQMELNFKFQHNENVAIKRNVVIASVYNYERMNNIFATYKPEIVFHAAAYKHVPLMEDSAVEAVRTNVCGTYNICKLASVHGVEKMVMVSSDKAVRPTNIMGATKRFAEMIVQHFNHENKTNYSIVRFGNVLGSNGSVVPLFKKQIANGGPLTVTDRNIIRYFMTIPEAVGLILQSGAFAKGGEIFILDMGDPVRIIDLAEKMIMLTGLRPYIDIDIQIVGLRPGEKLFEELLVDKNLDHIKTSNKKIFIESEKNIQPMEEHCLNIINTFEKLSNDEVKELIRKFVPTYNLNNNHNYKEEDKQ